MLKGSDFVNAFNNIFVKHRLAELFGFLFVGYDEVDYPVVDLLTKAATFVSLPPAILKVLDFDLAPNDFCPLLDIRIL